MIGIVILHYLAYDMTVQCVEQVGKTVSEAQIVIVDNASPNGTGVKLKELYGNEENVFVLLSNENVGFARGNNLGYEYLRRNYQPEFIIIMNNDVLIKQTDVDRKIKEIYENTGFAVLGPDIYNTVLGIHQNPSRLSQMSLDEVKSWIDRFQKVEDNYTFSYIKMKICDIRDRLFPPKRNEIERNVEYINPVLHGACYILSLTFIDKREYAFNPATFLYGEEDILAFECEQQGLKMMYSPEITVEHFEDVSTNMQFKNEYSKRRMKNREMLKSYTILFNLMRNE